MAKTELDNREPRALQMRDSTERPKKWMPPQLLPDPTPEEGYAYRWIRIATLGKDDAMNVCGCSALRLRLATSCAAVYHPGINPPGQDTVGHSVAGTLRSPRWLNQKPLLDRLKYKTQ